MSEILTIKNLAKIINSLLQKLEQFDTLSNKELEILTLILIYHQLDLTISGNNTFYAIKQANKYVTKYMSEFSKTEKFDINDTNDVYKIILNRLYQMQDESIIDDSEFNEKYKKNLDTNVINEVGETNDKDLLNQVNNILNSNIEDKTNNSTDDNINNNRNDEKDDEEGGELLI